jgi:low affinity Fe/Cu permease
VLGQPRLLGLATLHSMTQWTSRLLWICATGLVVWTGIFAIAMVSQLADAADRLHAGTGQAVFWVLMGLLIATVVVPTVWLLRLPAALRYPQATDIAAIAAYQQRLRAHLARNPHVRGMPLGSEQEVHLALTHLREKAESETRRTAASVLASTALLQNGRLDGLVVLVSQIQLVWRIARIYGLRPSFKQMSYLYGNVSACVLIASGLDEVDFAELSAPIVQSATPAAVGSIPGLGGVGHLLTNSLASGAANAFLTLRVGLIADAYCAPQLAPERQAIKQGATRRAAQLLGVIVKDCGTQITQAIYGRIKHGVVSTAQAAADSVKQAGRSVSGATQSAYQATTHSLSQAAAQVRNSTTSATQRLQQTIKPKEPE